jgi:hypothetical protein
MRYFFHIWERGARVPDDVGLELGGMAEARQEARLTACDLANGGGRHDVRIIEIADRHGKTLASLPLRGLLH